MPFLVANDGFRLLYRFVQGLLQTKWLWFEQPHQLSQYVDYDKGSEGPISALYLLWLLRGKYGGTLS